jgi:glycosyltransferase involved in cell wall biosynthesis/2-polyprenyl-3-methyl-5-hydroxy-6-metoxy-1,4-benzoquinol methylase
MEPFKKDLDIIASAYEDRNQPSYHQSVSARDTYIFKERKAAIFDVCFEHALYPLKDTRILDVGCGYGGVLEQFCDHLGLAQDHAYGVDLFHNRVQTCKEKMPDGEFVQASGHGLPFRDAQFDGILLFTVLSSIPSHAMQQNITQEIMRVLKPGGWLLCYDFRYGNPRNPHTQALQPRHLDALFPGWARETRYLTLIPPLSRCLEKVNLEWGYRLLRQFRFLRSHHLSFLYRKQASAGSQALKIAWLWPHELAERNRARYQRLLRFSSVYPVTLFARPHQPIAMEIHRRVDVLRAPYSSANLYVSYLVYFAWMFPTVLEGFLRNRWNTVYALPDFSSLIAGCLNCIGMKWIADMVDDPALEIQTLATKNYPKWALYRIHNLFLMAFLRNANAVIVVGFSEKVGLPETLRSTYHVAASKMIVTPNGVDLEHTLPSPQIRKNPIPVICYMGGVTGVRSLDLLIKAHAAMVSSGMECKLEFVGPVRTREDRKKLDDIIEELQTERWVEFTGLLPHADALERVRQADICVLVLDASVKNFQYTFPIKLFEYLALGKVVVSSRLAGVAQVIQHEENGILVEPGDADALQRGLQSILTDAALREKVEGNARASIAAYDWKILSDAVIAKVSDLLDPDQKTSSSEMYKR